MLHHIALIAMFITTVFTVISPDLFVRDSTINNCADVAKLLASPHISTKDASGKHRQFTEREKRCMSELFRNFPDEKPLVWTQQAMERGMDARSETLDPELMKQFQDGWQKGKVEFVNDPRLRQLLSNTQQLSKGAREKAIDMIILEKVFSITRNMPHQANLAKKGSVSKSNRVTALPKPGRYHWLHSKTPKAIISGLLAVVPTALIVPLIFLGTASASLLFDKARGGQTSDGVFYTRIVGVSLGIYAAFSALFYQIADSMAPPLEHTAAILPPA